MSTSTEAQGSADGEHILRPRAVKPFDSHLLRPQDDDGSVGLAEGGNSDVSSGRSTPLPPDAPPSAKSISSARRHIKAQQKQRIFPTIDYAPRVSHFDPASEHRDFRGFFVLFWIGLAIMVITTMLRNYKDTGNPMRRRIWSLFAIDIWQLGVSDVAMVASTSISLPLHLVFRSSNGWLSWGKAGMVIQSLYQAAWLVFWVSWPFILDWTWTAQVFFTLHTLSLIMKMHSYAFYNGHLSETQHRLSALDKPDSASTASVYRYPKSSSHLREEYAESEAKEKRKDRSLASLREDLAMELISPLGGVIYPQNLTVGNYADYLLCPTLCYELEFPRTEKIRWIEVMWKTLAVFGCIFLLTLISEEFILPVLIDSAFNLEHVGSLSEAGFILAESISLLLFPFIAIFLLVFLVIFEYVLGAFAEITRFSDRAFYDDWWNSNDWLEFSRQWNIPVHNFFRRHVYAASRPHMSRSVATFITFLISAFAHELVMACITKKARGYGFLAMMLQLPIVTVQRTRWMRGRKLFNVRPIDDG
ncbi:MAG: hypothetical protein M1833_000537 [Piccolia ochrophora]|nr:MAG: hypothetical protein M1833_000537 [Piccolia ochrophora]